MRCIALILAVITIVVQVSADAGEPFTLVRMQQWQGRIVRTPGRTSSFAVVAPRPTWSSTSPGVRLLRADGTEIRRGFLGADVRGLISWKQGYLVATVDSGMVDIRVVGEDLVMNDSYHTIIRSEQVRDAATAVELVDHPGTGLALLVIGGSAYAITDADDSLQVTPLESRVVSGLTMEPTGRGRIALVYTIGSSAFLSIIDGNLQAIATASVPSSDDARLVHAGHYVIMLSTVTGARGTVLTALNTHTFATFTRTIPIDQRLIAPWITSDGGLSLAVLTSRSGRPELVVTSGSDIPEVLPSGTFVPGEYGMPRSVHVIGDTAIVTFTGGVVMVDAGGSILSRDALVLGLSGDHEDILAVPEGFVLSTRATSVMLRRSAQPFWYIVRGIDLITRLVIPLVLLTIATIFWILYRRQRRFLDAVIDIPGAGLVVVLDANVRLVRTN